jgi:DNA repair photolyase
MEQETPIISSFFSWVNNMLKKMFGFITETWNPLVHNCPHKCKYCWARKLKAGKLKQTPRYADGKDKLIEKEFDKRWKKGDVIFVCDMCDLYAENVPDMWIRRVLDTISKSPDATFLLLTKNPSRFFFFRSIIPNNCILAATIESNRYDLSVSYAPDPRDRYMAMLSSSYPQKAIVVEPIMDFDLTFLEWFNTLRDKLEFIVVGYDNYKNQLPEPTLDKTELFIKDLKDMGFKVITKTIRKAWNEE